VDVRRRQGEHGVQVDEGECKGNTKGGNNKIGIGKKGKLEVLEKDQRGRLEWDLTVHNIVLFSCYTTTEYTVY